MTKKAIENYREQHPFLREVDNLHISSNLKLEAWVKMEEDINEITEENVSHSLSYHIMNIHMNGNSSKENSETDKNVEQKDTNEHNVDMNKKQQT